MDLLSVEGDHSSPEVLMLSEPFRDPYSSNDSLTEAEHMHRESTKNLKDPSDWISHLLFEAQLDLASSGVEETKNASSLHKQFVTESTHAKYNEENAEPNYLEAEESSLAACVEQLLDFALKEDPERRNLVDGKKLFDGKTASEIVHIWKKFFPNLNWLLEHFNHDLQQVNVDDMFAHLAAKNIKSDEEAHDLILNTNCISFVKQFVSKMKLLQEYENGDCVSSLFDKLHDKFKTVFGDIAKMLHIVHRNNAECKTKIMVSEFGEGLSVMKKHPVVCKPDFIFMAQDYALMIPVEVYTPISENNGVHIAGDMNENQLRHQERKFNAQHTMQHIGLLFEKIVWFITNQVPLAKSYNDVKRSHVSVGMFVNKSIIQFSKVVTTHKHLSSFIQDLLPRTVFMSDKDIAKQMKSNVQENGLTVTKSGWHIDMSKGLHRNALLVFLVHYFWGHTFFVECNVAYKPEVKEGSP